MNDQETQLRERLITLEAEVKNERKWLLIVGGILALMFGYTNLISIPSVAQRKATEAAANEVSDRMPDAAAEALDDWLEEKGGATILIALEDQTNRVERLALEADQDRRRIGTYLEDLSRESLKALPIDCHPEDEFHAYEANPAGIEFRTDLFSCEMDAPTSGLLFVSLQGHIKSTIPGERCAFSIFIDGKSADRAPRDFPSLTHSNIWSPAFMAEAVRVEEAGSVLLSLRTSGGPKGNGCRIHDPDIDGVFVPDRVLPAS